MKKNYLKKAVALGLVASMAVGATGCAGKANTKETASKSADVDWESEEWDECELTISWWGDDTRDQLTEEMIDGFETAYPGITVKSTYSAWDGWEEKMATAFVAGTEQDVNQVNWNWLSQYDQNGTVFMDLNDASSVIDLDQIDSKYLEMCTYDDTLRGLPISMTGRIFYWDKTTFDEVGIEVPTSLEELRAAGKAFEAYGEDYYPLSLGEYDRMILMVYYLESVYGEEWVTDGELNYDEKQVQEGLEFIQSLEDDHVIPSIATIAGDGAASLDQNSNWIDGHYAGIFEWDSSASKYKTAAEGREIVVGDFFADMGEYQGGYSKVSMAWAISANCEHPKEAALLVNYLLNNEDAAKIAGSTRGVPVSASAFAAANDAELLDATTVEANGKVLDWVSYSLDPTFESSELKSSDGTYYDVMAGLSYGEYDFATAAQTLIDGIETVLSE